MTSLIYDFHLYCHLLNNEMDAMTDDAILFLIYLHKLIDEVRAVAV